jgi:hypothetical protein
MSGNRALRQKAADLGFTHDELARRVNLQIQELTGKPGTVSERTVHNWMAGATQWPPAKIRFALGAVFGCAPEHLGFHPPDGVVKRRAFLAATARTAMVAAGPAQQRIGVGDVQRLQARFAEVIARDHLHGGRKSIESDALALAEEAIGLQQVGSASQRVRGQLYATAAAFTSSAMWAAIDGRRFDAAQDHHRRASGLAAMSGDPTIAFRIWSHAGSMYRHLGRPVDAQAANDVARRLSITRRDPLFASLGHARHAAILGLTGDANAVRRAIDRAQEALDQADPAADRPTWITIHYDQAELDSLALAAHLALGSFEDAEARAHRSLAVLRSHMKRSRGITTARLARAQLGQGDIDHAIHTAMSVPADQAAHPRVAGMLASFGRSVHELAGADSNARTWDQWANDTRRTST